MTALAAGVLIGAPAAFADVLSIGEDGTVVRQSGPAQYLTPDMTPRPIVAGRQAQPSAAKAPAPSSPPASLREDIRIAAGAAGLSPTLLEALAWRESRFNARAVSPKGARGPMQLMPATAQALGVNPDDPTANVRGGVRYLAQMLRRYDGDLVKALAAYNAGPGAVDRYGGVPPFRETRAYVDAILERMAHAAVNDLPRNTP